MIDKQSPIPIYYQLEEWVKHNIERGEWEEGMMIPSERELAEKHEVSRMTIRQAINNLVNAGYLSREKGKGTFVEPNKIEQPLQGLTSFTEDMEARGMKPGARLLSIGIVSATEMVANRLDISEGSQVFELRRVRLADDQPMALEATYLPVELVPEFSETIANHSLYDYIENELGFEVEKATQSIEASIVSDEERDVLGLESGDPVLLIERCTSLKDGRPLEFVKSVYRADRYKFYIDMNR
ncbi:GntR family transcriptional regulator [Texcoconibacillus texcoconensis]|uniref:GntR family transcriptional regulator n=1 Tax=Texcoconibacillus texcoconensis TaxID=1095777 RepID=A0A840QTT4_9BACI|nr:GntR family transcriptional regulator [Texcoconibacillus texcoconensis]MBB5174709.1 GntR family transcriptional regulator [Texcoconibacillus texcoconensis]